MDHFYLNKISLENFRQFEHKEIIFNSQMNLAVGSNSSGKTSILEAVCIALGAYLAAFKTYVPSRFVYNISESDVRMKGQTLETKDILLSPEVQQYPCKVSADLMIDHKNYFYKRMIEKKGGRTKFDGTNPMQSTIISWEKSMAMGDGSDSALIFPLVLYLSSARLWNENKESDFDFSIPLRTDAYHRCLDKKRGMQMPFRYIQYLKEISIQEKNGVDFPAYTLIMDAINRCMEGELKTDQVIEYSMRYRSLALVEADGTRIPFDGLSDGYRGVMKIVADIAVRMCILNPYLKEKTFERTPGIVAIDELDLSLHPKWQKRIIRTLTSLFPKVQFICASHSPFLIQALEEGQLISMEGMVDEEYSGESIEDIAENIMGVENARYSDKKQEMYHAAEEYYQALNCAVSQEELQRLKEKLDVLMAEYSDNPAYCAWMKQRYLVKQAEMGKKE